MLRAKLWMSLKKDGLVVGEVESKKDFDGFISILDPFHIHLVESFPSALLDFKIKGVLLEDYFGDITYLE